MGLPSGLLLGKEKELIIYAAGTVVAFGTSAVVATMTAPMTADSVNTGLAGAELTL